MGLGQSMLLLPSLAIIGQHFRRRRALATGLATSVGIFLDRLISDYKPRLILAMRPGRFGGRTCMAYTFESPQQAHIVREFHSSDCRGRSGSFNCCKSYHENETFQGSSGGAAELHNYLPRLSVSRVNNVVCAFISTTRSPA